jgi:polyisoprenoid-binding protein YceI
MKKYVLIFFMIAGTIYSTTAQTKWVIDKAHSNIGFSVMHYVITEVEGNFQDFDGSVMATGDSFEGAAVEFAAQTASVDTDNEKRDNHLKSDDFFNAKQYPEIKFKGKLQKNGGKLQLVGDFTMRDVTKQVTFDVQHNGTVDLGKGKKAGFKITGTIDRFEYGVKFNKALETGGLVVAQEVDITCNIELNEAKGT